MEAILATPEGAVVEEVTEAPVENSNIPQPGIYRDISADEYHSWDAASNSQLGKLIKSPAHLRAYLQSSHSPTPALVLGTALHTKLLEPELFEAQYCQAEQCEERTAKKERCSKGGKVRRNGRWLCGTHDKEGDTPGDAITVLSSEQWDQVHAMAAAIRKHPGARTLLDLDGERELSLVWDDPKSGVRCKARLDKVAPALSAVVDIKTTLDAHPKRFPKSILDYGYYRQAAHYLAAAEVHGIAAKHFVIIAVEKSSPFAVSVYRLDRESVLAGRQHLDELLATYAECTTNDIWPGYPEIIQDVGIPSWALSAFDTSYDEEN